jgi:argininosuccinate synthase
MSMQYCAAAHVNAGPRAATCARTATVATSPGDSAEWGAGGIALKKVVLAYSGGLDTSVAVAWLREQYGHEVVTLTVDVGGGSLRDGVGRASAGPARAAPTSSMPGSVRRGLRLAQPAGQRALPGRLPAGHRPRSAADRPAARRGRPARGRRRGRPRLHRQGQRPGPLRRRHVKALDPRLEVDRADARRHGPDPRAGDRVRRTRAASRSRSPSASPYSIDVNLWGRSIETGVLEDPWVTPPADVYEWTVDAGDAPPASRPS